MVGHIFVSFVARLSGDLGTLLGKGVLMFMSRCSGR